MFGGKNMAGILQLVEQEHSVLVTGTCGRGKTFLLKLSMILLFSHTHIYGYSFNTLSQRREREREELKLCFHDFEQQIHGICIIKNKHTIINNSVINLY